MYSEDQLSGGGGGRGVTGTEDHDNGILVATNVYFDD